MPATEQHPRSSQVSQTPGIASPAEWVRIFDAPFRAAQNEFVHWNHSLAQSESAWIEHVYTNPNFTSFDARQHRAMLYQIIGAGEMLVIKLLALNTPSQPGSYIETLEEKLTRLKGLLYEWHGPGVEEAETDDFASAIRQVAAGKEVDLDKALMDDPP